MRHRNSHQSLFFALLGLPLLGACTGSGNPAAVDAATPDAFVDAGPANRNIDILFVVDNSASMGEEQTSLAVDFPAFMSVLSHIEGGLPNLHIGVISSNVGVDGFNIVNCQGQGDNGELQSTPHGRSCTAPDGKFISDVAAADGTTRVKNYTGTLADTFGCISELGTLGCGFEQHLESMKRALDGSQAQNAGFLRPDALLAVIFVADEDDCSAADPRIYNPAEIPPNPELGPLTSFRCTEFGVTCAEGNLTRSAASYTGCRPRVDSFLGDPQRYVTFLKGLKSNPNMILVAGIIGNPSPVRVMLDQNNAPQLDHSCQGSSGAADPGVRLKYFLDQFPGSVTTSICNADLSSALQRIAEQLAGTVGP